MKMESCLLIFSLLSLLMSTTANSDVRLVNGNSPCEGRAEVRHQGQWGTVCDDGWDMTDALVVCRQMFCGDAVAAPQYGHFGAGTGRIWLSNVNCGGSESTLKDCVRRGWGQHTCTHAEDAGVICSGLAVRLAGGPHPCSGRLEFHHKDSWYTVCDPDFDLQDAKVVCRQLGCGTPVQVQGAAVFGKGDDQVWKNKVECGGDERDFGQCLRSSTKETKCTHDTDVGLECFWYTKGRLVDGPDSCSGTVELQYLTEWGTMCDASWDLRAANVLCQQLGCGSAVAVSGQAWFGEGKGSVWADVFECQGKETHLSQCVVSSWNRAPCSHEHDAGVICTGSSLSTLNGTVRLSGESGCGGQLEVHYQHTWSRVLLDSWSIREAFVVCRQLGCGSALRIYSSFLSGTGDTDVCLTGYQCSGTESHLVNCNAPHTVNCSSSPYVSIVCSKHRSLRLVGGNGSIWLDEVGCEGNELSLWDCPSAKWGNHDCVHKEDVGVVCSEYKDLRLAERCSGQVEVYYNGTWGNVCFNQMDTNTCPSSPWGQNKCDDGEVALITCESYLALRLQGGNRMCSGRVELWSQGSWGTICDDLWDINDAQVVCRQLGCGAALKAHGNAAFGSGNGPIWLNEVKCWGSERHLWDCPHSLQDHRTSCSHKEDAGVTCEGG
ncbi:scavenger receptor cysteine-rich type 1 protein M130-like [Scleropages formosus]|uniref:scavenger receptor cysteine-rich type 1 protein M130-like n=1 Tax=Scleropages formosus TaxID=113540 RepID=UPI0010FA8A8C|nr:scavenger receptor cysteine-rich type 1 protein M130-like [Scleropages formosus]